MIFPASALRELAYGPDDEGPQRGAWTLEAIGVGTFETEFCNDHPAYEGECVRVFAKNGGDEDGADARGRTVGEALTACAGILAKKHGVMVVPVRRTVKP